MIIEEEDLIIDLEEIKIMYTVIEINLMVIIT